MVLARIKGDHFASNDETKQFPSIVDVIGLRVSAGLLFRIGRLNMQTAVGIPIDGNFFMRDAPLTFICPDISKKSRFCQPGNRSNQEDLPRNLVWDAVVPQYAPGTPGFHVFNGES